MVYQSLILGILLGIGIFAAKTAVGIYYFLSRLDRRWQQATALLLFAAGYLLVFAGTSLFLEKIDLMRHLAAIQSFIRSGMLIHLILAGLLLTWGVTLLKQGEGMHHKSKGWLILAVPCPVCITVIVFSAGFLITCFPENPARVVTLLYLTFMLINLGTMLVIALYQKQRPVRPESFLGGAMILIAVYFLLSVTVMPRFSDMDKIYRLAMYQGQAHSQPVSHLTLFSILSLAAFAGGFALKLKTIRRPS